MQGSQSEIAPRMTAVRAGGCELILAPWVQIARDHQLEGQLVGTCGHADSHASLDIKSLGAVIYHGPDLVKLLRYGKEFVQRTEVGILFGGHGPFVVQVVRNAGRGNVFEMLDPANVVGVHDGVVDDVPRMQMDTDDRPDLGGDAPGFPVVVVDAELEVDAVKEEVILGVGAHEQFSQLEAVDGGAAPAGDGSGHRQVEPLLKPVGDTVGPLERGVEGLVSDDRAGEVGRLSADGRVIVVHHQIEHARFGDLGIVDLDFVGLGDGRRCGQQNKRDDRWNTAIHALQSELRSWIRARFSVDMFFQYTESVQGGSSSGSLRVDAGRASV